MKLYWVSDVLNLSFNKRGLMKTQTNVFIRKTLLQLLFSGAKFQTY